MGRDNMLTEYIDAAMRRACYEILSEDGLVYGEIPELQGVWATAPTDQACRAELEEVLEEWLTLRLSHNLAVPPLDGIELAFSRREEA